MVDILNRVGIKSSPDEVYKALSTREGLAGWWTTHTQGEGKVGSVIAFRFTSDGAELGSIHMKVLELQPAKRVLWQVVDGPEDWIGTTVSWDLRQEGDYCVVLLKHQGWKEPVEFMYHCTTKWAVYMVSLKSLLETGKGAPNPHDVRLHDKD
ncbi:MAG: polyketide cyclase [Burkholderiales bacterium RIFCSPLOWO2_12_67_14]|nr:MAG: polyketide cyclase [Burkholderiales bacterium RIFCSPLOWO2_02_FULL_67_64]OGB51139.1 MAG: polyketide cyclase [Burkholderiales bacterium RIFCSPLOWO2_12_67_14]OGB53189.1 MAG: polyketide cyclase [Burkholderiales bacterium RIFCSPHIGHO2_12_FULL_67_38]OGB76442.1 MAG: polyketide cyclase [Burkholderiales bacterium RIFCSPLOWO2_12_FULL_67_210]